MTTKTTIIALLMITSSFQLFDPSPYYGWNLCSGFDETYLTITDLQMSEIPTSGQTFYMTLTGRINTSFYCPYALITLKYGAIKFWSGKVDINTKAVEGQVLTHKFPIHGELAPPGKYTGILNVFDNTGNEVDCMEFWFIMRRNPGGKMEIEGPFMTN